MLVLEGGRLAVKSCPHSLPVMAIDRWPVLAISSGPETFYTGFNLEIPRAGANSQVRKPRLGETKSKTWYYSEVGSNPGLALYIAPCFFPSLFD